MWAERPAKKKVVEAAVKDVIYLLELRQVLMEKMLEEFVAGVNIYLSHVRDASLGDSNKYLVSITHKYRYRCTSNTCTCKQLLDICEV